MSKKELVVLWIVGIYTALFTFFIFQVEMILPAFGGGLSPQEEIENIIIHQPEIFYIILTRMVVTYLIPVWIVGGLFFITFRNTRKKK